MKTIIAMMAAAAMLFNGCKDIGSGQSPSQGGEPASLPSTAVVCIGVENGWAGACPGAAVDAKRMAKLLKLQAGNAKLLLDKEATVNNVKAALSDAVKSDFAVVFYSGHGGQDSRGDASEADGKDEFMCLYDKPLYDNDIWKILSTGKRVLLICDCCHSATMFRTAVFSRRAKLLKAGKDSSSVQMLCWSGCPDNTYSYGSEDGGQLTNALLKHFDAALTYKQLWSKVKSDKQLKQFEDVQETVIGADFREFQVFK